MVRPRLVISSSMALGTMKMSRGDVGRMSANHLNLGKKNMPFFARNRGVTAPVVCGHMMIFSVVRPRKVAERKLLSAFTILLIVESLS